MLLPSRRLCLLDQGAILPQSRRLPWRIAKLPVIQGGIQAVDGQQLVVRTLLHQSTVVEDQDEVGREDRRETVRDDDAGAAAHQRNESLLDQRLRGRIQRAGRLVEDEDAGILEQRVRWRAAAFRLRTAGSLVHPRSSHSPSAAKR